MAINIKDILSGKVVSDMEEYKKSKNPVLPDYLQEPLKIPKYTAKQIVNAIEQVESSGGVNTMGKSGEKGVLQYMPATWSEFSNAYLKSLGKSGKLPQTPENEKKVAEWKVQSWIDQGMEADQIASKWNSGKVDYSGNVGTNKYGVKYDTPNYVTKVLNVLEPQPQKTQQELSDELTQKFNLPSVKASVLDVVKEVGKNIWSIPQTISRFPVAVTKSITGQEVMPEAEKGSALEKAQSFVFGEQPVGTIKEEAEPLSQLIEKTGLSKEVSSNLGTGAFLALGALDYTTFGGASNAIKLLSKTDDFVKTTNILKKTGVGDDLLNWASRTIAPLKDEKEISNILNNLDNVQKMTKAKPAVQFVKETPQIISTTGKTGLVAKKEIISGAKSGLPTTKKMVTTSETSLLKNKIKTLQQGVKIGRADMKAGIKELQTNAVDLVQNNLPVALRGKHITDIKNSTSISGFTKAVDNIASSIKSYNEAKVLSKTLGEKRSKFAFIRKLSEINQTAVNEIKREAGITKGLIKADDAQLDKAISLIKERFQFKMEKGMIDLPQNTKMAFSEYQKKLSMKPKGVGQKIKEFITKEKKPTLDKVIGVISTRLSNISKDIGNRMRKAEFNVLKNSSKSQKINDEIFKGIKKLSNEDKAIIKLAWNGEDFDVVQKIANKGGFGEQITKIRSYLDDIEKRAKEARIEMGHIENYMPKFVKDKEGLLKYLNDNGVIERALKERSKKLGRELTQDEISEFTSSVMRGFDGSNKVFLTSGHIKNRILEHTAELDQFYGEPFEAISKYTNDMENMIEASNLFKGKIKELADGSVDWSETIGSYVKGLNLTPLKQEELRNILVARFGYIGSQGLTKNLKDLTYLTNLNNVLNTITQGGDLGFSLYTNGIMDTIKGMVKTLGKGGVKVEDIGIGQPMAELETGGVLSKALNKIFTSTFFRSMDRFGKETLMNATVNRYKNQASKFLSSGKETSEIKYIRKIFGDKTDDVIKSLSKGELNEDTHFLAFNKLSDFQPITLSEVPEQYLKHPNGRIFYALKTFQIKQLDVFRREVFQQFKQGNIKGGVKNAVRLVTLLTAANVTTDTIKDILQGKEIDLKDSSIDNLISLSGMNRYFFESAYGTGVGGAAFDFVTPPLVDVVTNLGKDIKDIATDKIDDPLKEMRSVQYFPWVGRIFYNREGRGSKKNKDSKPRFKL